MKTTKTTLLIGALVILFIFLFSWGRLFPVKSQSIVTDPHLLPGIQTTQTMWSPELQNLAARLRMIGLSPLSQEGTVLHIHQHIDIFIHNKQISIPEGIGINQAAGFISVLHTHDSSGVIHLESPKVQSFTLGQFFDIWGVLFTSNCIGGYCADKTNTLKVYVNGMLVSSDPRLVVLTPHQEIVVIYGTAGEIPNPIPATYAFPAGL